MGGFLTALGSGAAQGFEQARQQDLSRQFADEQNRRSMASELLGHIALDPNQPDEVRTPFLNAYMNLAQLPPDKSFDFKKHMAPAFDALAQYRLKQQQAVQHAASQPAPPVGSTLPAAPPQIQAPARQLAFSQVPVMGAPAPGGIGPIAQSQAPAFSMPPPPPQSGASMTAGSGAPTPMAASAPPSGALAGPPPPPAGFLASAHRIAENKGYEAQQEAAGTMRGQLGVIGEAADKILADHPEYANDPMIGPALAMARLNKTLPFAAMTRTVGTGSGFAGDLRKQGEPVPSNIPDNQFVNKRELASGRVTYEASTPSWIMPTVRENTIQVPQADGSIKAYANTSVNRKAFGLPEGTTPVGVSASPKAGVTQGKTIGGKAPTPAIMIAPPTQPGAPPRAIAVRPGSAVPTGAVTASGLSSANVPTSPIRTMAERSAAQIPIIDQVSKEVDRLDKAGKLGPMAGRWNAFMQGKVGAGDPDYSYLNDKVNMIQSAMMIIHSGGRTTGPILKKFEDMLNAGKMDAPTLKAGLRAIREQMQTYAKEGTIPGFGGGPPAPSQGGGAGDFFSQFGGAAR